MAGPLSAQRTEREHVQQIGLLGCRVKSVLVNMLSVLRKLQGFPAGDPGLGWPVHLSSGEEWFYEGISKAGKGGIFWGYWPDCVHSPSGSPSTA